MMNGLGGIGKNMSFLGYAQMKIGQQKYPPIGHFEYVMTLVLLTFLLSIVGATYSCKISDHKSYG